MSVDEFLAQQSRERRAVIARLARFDREGVAAIVRKHVELAKHRTPSEFFSRRGSTSDSIPSVSPTGIFRHGVW